MTREPSVSIPERPALPSISAFVGRSLRYVMSGRRWSPTDDDDLGAVAERRDRLVPRTRHEDFGRGVGSHARYSHSPTLLGREISPASLILLRRP